MLSEDSNRFWAGGGPGGVFTISVAERDVPLMFADSVTVVLALTAAVVTGKLALEAPAGTVTLAGTAAAAGLLLDKGTDNPPAGATFASVTMPCAVSPPMTVVELGRASWRERGADGGVAGACRTKSREGYPRGGGTYAR